MLQKFPQANIISLNQLTVSAIKLRKQPYVAYDNDSPAQGAWLLGLSSDN